MCEPVHRSGAVNLPPTLVSVPAPTEHKLDIEAIKEKVKRAKTKRLGAPPVNPTPPISTTNGKKKKNKNKG